MEELAKYFGAWGAVIAFLAAVATSTVILSQWKSKREDEWRKTAEAHEDRVKVLEHQVDDNRRELFDVSIQLADMKRNERRLGLKNLDQQKQIDRQHRRIHQLEAALAMAMIPLPLEDGDDEGE